MIFVIGFRQDYANWRSEVATPEEANLKAHMHVSSAKQLRGHRLTAECRVIHVGRHWELPERREIAESLAIMRHRLAAQPTPAPQPAASTKQGHMTMRAQGTSARVRTERILPAGVTRVGRKCGEVRPW